MKQQSDKLTAYYYRAATINKELFFDNQMYRLLRHAVQNDKSTYVLYADHGYSGMDSNRPAFAELLRQVKANRIRKVIVTDASRISRNTPDFYAFAKQAKKRGTRIETVDGESLCEEAEMYEKLSDVLTLKGGESR